MLKIIKTVANKKLWKVLYDCIFVSSVKVTVKPESEKIYDKMLAFLGNSSMLVCPTWYVI